MERDFILENERRGKKYACFVYKDCPGDSTSRTVAKDMTLLGMPGINV